MKNIILFISCLSVVFYLISCKTTSPKNDSIIYLTPQNISQPKTFDVSHDGSVGFYDPLTLKIYQYSLKGEYINSINIPNAASTNIEENKGENYLKNIFFLGKDKLFCSHYLTNNSRCLYSQIDLLNDSLEAISTLNRNFLLPNYITSVSPHPIAHFDDIITFIKPFNDTIFEFSNQSLRPRYILSIDEDKKIPTNFLENHAQSAEWGIIRKML